MGLSALDLGWLWVFFWLRHLVYQQELHGVQAFNLRIRHGRQIQPCFHIVPQVEHVVQRRGRDHSPMDFNVSSGNA